MSEVERAMSLFGSTKTGTERTTSGFSLLVPSDPAYLQRHLIYISKGMDSNLALLLGALDSGTCKTFFKLMKARDFRPQKNQFVL